MPVVIISHLNRHILNTVNLKKNGNLKSIIKIKIQVYNRIRNYIFVCIAQIKIIKLGV